MKRNFSLWLGVVALLFAPVLVQGQAAQAVQMGKIHGTVTNPVGTVEPAGTVSLSSDGGHTNKYTFQLDANGFYKGEAAPGTYTAIFREPNTPQDKMIDSFDNVKIVAGQDLELNFDMTREAYIKKLPPEQQKELEEIRKKNAAAMKENAVIKQLNADLKKVSEDLKASDNARATAIQQLGSSATKADVATKEAEIKKEQYTDIQTMMQKDAQLRPDQAILWAYLGQAQVGLQEYDQAEDSYKKAIAAEAAGKKRQPEVAAMSHAGLGTVYARTGKVKEANAEFDQAGQIDPAKAGFYLRNETIIFFQMGNGDAQIAAADEAIKADPNDALLYYLKGQGLVQKATFDSKTNKIILPPGCQEAYEKYLQLAPDGPYAGEVKGILQQAGQKQETSFKAGRKHR